MKIETYTFSTAMGAGSKSDLPFLSSTEMTELNKIGSSGKNNKGERTSRMDYLNSIGKGVFSVLQTKFDNGDFTERFTIIRVLAIPALKLEGGNNYSDNQEVFNNMVNTLRRFDGESVLLALKESGNDEWVEQVNSRTRSFKSLDDMRQECIDLDWGNVAGGDKSIGHHCNGKFYQFTTEKEIELFYAAIPIKELVSIYCQYNGLDSIDEYDANEEGYLVSISELNKNFQ